MITESIGAACFGLVIGWVTYRTLRRSAQEISVSDIATVTGAVGGAAVTGIVGNPQMFACYAIGLAVGFFSYLVTSTFIGKHHEWLDGD